MAKRSNVPTYCHHKGRNLAYVTLNGKEVYLGRYGSDESKEKYARVIAEQFPTCATNGTSQPPTAASSLTINELILSFWTEFVATTYVKDGKPTERQYHIRQAMRPLKALYGGTLANKFGPKALKTIRQKMIDTGVERRGGLNRAYLNDHVNIIKRMFRWAVSEELIDVAVHQRLCTVENIRKGRDTRVKESKKVKPAPEKDVQAVLRHVVPQVGAMIQVQHLTGMRPDEVTIMRPCDIDQSDQVWLYTPESHKLENLDIERQIPIGPTAQQVLKPWLERKADAYLFSPREAMEAKTAKSRKNGHTRNPSKFVISTATPVTSGRLNTVLAVDFNSELDRPVPRLRVAYGEYINDDLDYALLAGQTFTTMVDLKAQPETLDFAGPTGLFARRQPVAKFSKLFGREILTELAMETPEGSIFIDAMPLSQVPAFVGAVNWLPNGDFIRNLRFAGLARALNAELPDGSQDSDLGWAFVGSGRVMLPSRCEKDNVCFNIQFGDGYGGQLKSGPADAVLNLATSELVKIRVFSAYGGVQHWWTESVRTNLSCGYNSAENPAFIDGGALKSTLYASGNLVWNPFEKVTVGVEYLYGNLKNEDGTSGEANRLLFSSRFIY